MIPLSITDVKYFIIFIVSVREECWIGIWGTSGSQYTFYNGLGYFAAKFTYGHLNDPLGSGDCVILTTQSKFQRSECSVVSNRPVLCM